VGASRKPEKKTKKPLCSLLYSIRRNPVTEGDATVSICPFDFASFCMHRQTNVRPSPANQRAHVRSSFLLW